MIEERTAQLQQCMYQYSRAIYRSVKDMIDPYSDRRTQLGHEAAADKLALKTVRQGHKELLRRAQLAKVELVLATSDGSATAGRFKRTLDDAGSALVRELELLFYALIVAGPLLVLGGIAIAVGRAQRRRSDRRLLERT